MSKPVSSAVLRDTSTITPPLFDTADDTKFDAIVANCREDERDPTAAELAEMIRISNATGWDQSDALFAEIVPAVDALKELCHKYGLPFLVIVQGTGNIRADADGFHKQATLQMSRGGCGRHPRSVHEMLAALAQLLDTHDAMSALAAGQAQQDSTARDSN